MSLLHHECSNGALRLSISGLLYDLLRDLISSNWYHSCRIQLIFINAHLAKCVPSGGETKILGATIDRVVTVSMS